MCLSLAMSSMALCALSLSALWTLATLSISCASNTGRPPLSCQGKHQSHRTQATSTVLLTLLCSQKQLLQHASWQRVFSRCIPDEWLRQRNGSLQKCWSK